MEMLLIYLITAQLTIEWLGYQKDLWTAKRYLLFVHMIMIGISTGLLISYFLSFWTILLVIIQIYRILNLLRLTQNRLNDKQLRTVGRRSSVALALVLVLVAAFGYLQNNHEISPVIVLSIFLTAMLLAAMAMGLTLKDRLHRSRISLKAGLLSDDELPTLTVAIPARNETTELSDCIHSLLACDYSKLEILVLDDCSHDKTSDIIKSFAHRGVRFIKGSPPPPGWLAKNWAYKQLLDSANAEIVLFCGVDVRFKPQTLRQAVSALKSNQLQMISILPRRPSRESLYMIWQPMRYWRELAFPEQLRGGYPPALSTVWLADVDSIKTLGGFGAYRKAIRPEYLFARAFDARDSYRFLLNGSHLDIESVKPLSAQLETARRTRYPELKKRVENVLASTVLIVGLFIVPYAALIFGLFKGESLLILISFGLIALTLLMQSMIVYAAGRSINFLSVVFLPLIAICEVFVENYSMWAYEFSSVDWKGRNICLPVLQTSSHLPKLDR